MEGGGGGGAGPNGTAPGTGNWPRQQRLKDLGSKLTGLQRMNHFAQLLVDEYAALLRKLVSFAWEDRYQQPWEDGFACGAQMLYGCGPFSEVLCEIEVQPRPTNVLRVPKTPPPRISDGEASGSHARHPRTDDGRNYAPSPDLRVNADTSKGHNTTPVEQKKPSITKGTPLKIGDHILQVKRIKKDRIELRSAYPGPNAQKAVTVTVMHQSRDFYDQQIHDGCAVRSRASQGLLREGNPALWDMTILNWVLFYSAHAPDPAPQLMGDDSSRTTTEEGNNDGEANQQTSNVKGLLGLARQQLRNSLFAVNQRLRNEAFAHNNQWTMDLDLFVGNCMMLLDAAVLIDQHARERTWSRWSEVASPFFNTMVDLMQKDVEREDQRRYMQFLRHKPLYIPFQRNVQFTGRDWLMAHVHACLFSEADTLLDADHSVDAPPTCVLTGLGGIGKTATAVEYALKRKYLYGGGIITLQAETENSLTTALRAVALDLLAVDSVQKLKWQADIDNDPKKSMLQAWWYVHRWLQATKQWLLILDNVDRPDRLRSTCIWKELMNLGKSGGHVLITSRASPRHWTMGEVKAVAVAQVQPKQSERMLLKYKMNLETNEEADQEVARLPHNEVEAVHAVSIALDGLPLAIEQAGSYMRAVECSFAEYRDRFNAHVSRTSSVAFFGRPEAAPSSISQPVQQSLQQFLDDVQLGKHGYVELFAKEPHCGSIDSLLNMDSIDRLYSLQDIGITNRSHQRTICEACENSAQYNKTVATTWAMNVSELPWRARQLLNAVSLLAPDSIPTGLFLRRILANFTSPISDVDIDGDVATLEHFSLVKKYHTVACTSCLSVHRLLQLFTRHRMKQEPPPARHGDLSPDTVVLLSTQGHARGELGIVVPATKTREGGSPDHAGGAATKFRGIDGDTSSAPNGCDDTTDSAQATVVVRCRDHTKRVSATETQTLCEVEVACWVVSDALDFFLAGPQQSTDLLPHCLSMTANCDLCFSSNTLPVVVHSVAVCSLHSGELLDERLCHFEDAAAQFSMANKWFGGGAPDSTMTENSVPSEMPEQRSLRCQALEGLASCKHQQGDRKASLRLLDEVLQLTSVADSTSALQQARARARGQIAVVLGEENRYEEAESHFDDLLQTDGLPNIGALCNRGDMRYHQGRFDEAREDLEKARALCLEHGASDKQLAPVLANLGKIYNLGHKADDHHRALDAAEAVLAIYQRIHGSIPHTSVALALHNLAVLHGTVNDVEQHLKYAKQAVDMKRQIPTLDQREICLSLGSLGLAQARSGQFVEAETSVAALRAMHESGISVPSATLSLAVAMCDCVESILYFLKGETDKAATCATRAWEMLTRLDTVPSDCDSGDAPMQIADQKRVCAKSLVAIKMSMSKYAEARTFAQHELDNARKLLGPGARKSVRVAEALFDVGCCAFSDGAHEDGIKSVREGVKMMLFCTNGTNPLLFHQQQALSNMERQQEMRPLEQWASRTEKTLRQHVQQCRQKYDLGSATMSVQAIQAAEAEFKKMLTRLLEQCREDPLLEQKEKALIAHALTAFQQSIVPRHHSRQDTPLDWDTAMVKRILLAGNHVLKQQAQVPLKETLAAHKVMLDKLRWVRDRHGLNQTIAGPPEASYHCTTALPQLKPVFITSLQLGQLNTDAVLWLEVVGGFYTIVGGTGLVQDASGHCIVIGLYNYFRQSVVTPDDCDKILPVGTVFALKAPYVKMARHGNVMLRCDEPRNVEVQKGGWSRRDSPLSPVGRVSSGSQVQVHGLKKAPKYNLRCGTVVRFVHKSDRYSCAIDTGQTPSCKHVNLSISPKNLRAIVPDCELACLLGLDCSLNGVKCTLLEQQRGRGDGMVGMCLVSVSGFRRWLPITNVVLPQGTTIRVHSLKKNTELNGLSGTVRTRVTNPGSGEIKVRCEVLLENGKLYSLKLSNLSVWPDAPLGTATLPRSHGSGGGGGGGND